MEGKKNAVTRKCKSEHAVKIRKKSGSPLHFRRIYSSVYVLKKFLISSGSGYIHHAEALGSCPQCELEPLQPQAMAAEGNLEGYAFVGCMYLGQSVRCGFLYIYHVIKATRHILLVALLLACNVSGRNVARTTPEKVIPIHGFFTGTGWQKLAQENI